jgi:hypothetical protein
MDAVIPALTVVEISGLGRAGGDERALRSFVLQKSLPHQRKGARHEIVLLGDFGCV